MTTKDTCDALAELKPCPFCGNQLLARWTSPNPKAQCKTAGCMGMKLPVICLDVPEQIAAWNNRATQDAASGQGRAIHYSQPTEPAQQPAPDEAVLDLIVRVVDAARDALDESTDALDTINIPSHLAAVLSLCVDDYDRAILQAPFPLPQKRLTP